MKMLVFDFDGTLVDTMQGFADVAADVVSTRYSVAFAWAREKYLETSGIPFFQQLEVMFPNDARNEQSADEFEERKLEGFFSEKFDDDVRNTLISLKSQGYRVAVSSNNFQHLLDQFVASETIEFDMVLGCRENFFKGADHFNHIQSVLGVGPHEILFVGDSLVDGQRARESGIRFVGRTGTFTADAFCEAHPNTQTVDQLSELASILESIH